VSGGRRSSQKLTVSVREKVKKDTSGSNQEHHLQSENPFLTMTELVGQKGFILQF